MSTMPVGPALAVVADLQDLAVAHVPDHAGAVAQPGDPQADRLDGADGAHAGVDQVADAVLVLEDQEDAGQEVLAPATGRRSRPRRPTMPALASSGPIGSPTTSRIIRAATPAMTPVVMLRSTERHGLGPLPAALGEQRVAEQLAGVALGEHAGHGALGGAGRDPPDHPVHQRTGSARRSSRMTRICAGLREQPVRRLGQPLVAGPVVDPVAEGAGLLVVHAAAEPDQRRSVGTDRVAANGTGEPPRGRSRVAVRGYRVRNVSRRRGRCARPRS